jgi:hypothetical protein
MTLRLAQPNTDWRTDLVLLTPAQVMAIGTHYRQSDRVALERIRPCVRLREPHLTAQIDRLNDVVDNRFDWDAQIGGAM